MHCSASPEQFCRSDMSTDELLSLIDDLAACKVFLICLTGGEPLMHPDFFVFADAVLKHPMRLQINTNATLVDSHVAQRLSNLYRTPFISVSLDGITKETHDRIRGLGSFDRVMHGIHELQSANLNIRPFVVLSKLNCHEICDIVRFCSSLRVKKVFLSSPVTSGRAMCYENEMLLEPDLFRKTLENIIRIDKNDPDLLTGPWLSMARIYSAMKNNDFKSVEHNDGIFRNCGAARKQAAIACDGTVAPCQMAFSYRAGNVRDEPFIEIWKNSKVFKNVRNCQGVPLASISGCEDCSWHHLCKGPCPASGYSKTSIWPSAGSMCIRDIGELLEEAISA